jgi:hypothetical protein
MPALTVRLLRSLVAVAAIVVVGHDLVYTAAYGPAASAAREATGHGPYWAWTWAAVVVGAAILLAAGIRAAVGLARRAAAERARPDWQLSPYVRGVLRLWPRLAIAALVVFGVQENLEHFATHGSHLIGWQVLWSGEYALTLPSFGLVSLLVAALVALFTRTLAVLEAAIRAAQPQWSRAPRSAARPPIADVVRSGWGTLATPDLGRAPPA